jgi:8-oxo-dGTP pyrophosphatase MutT (NUDIX family)
LDKVLFHNPYLAVIERDGYIFAREVRCNGVIVCLLPFRITPDYPEFLARLEICPAHGPELERCSITGGVESGESIQEAAFQELWEEAGYRVKVDDLISLGLMRPSKSADTVVHLFAVDVTGQSQSPPPGDGTRFEATASVEWVNEEQGLEIADPLFVAAMARLKSYYQTAASKDWAGD